MNGGTTTDAQTTSASPVREHSSRVAQAADATKVTNRDLTNGHGGEPDSEAETLIDSPVKKAEAAKQNAAAKKKGEQNMTKNEDLQNGDEDAPGSPDSHSAHAVSKDAMRLRKHGSDGSDSGSSSEDLSDVDNDSDTSASANNALQTLNPRKRKHRASSVSLPNKRPSIDASRRRKRGATEDRAIRDEPTSPHSRAHRRATSNHSVHEDTSNRKRRSIIASRETKNTRRAWDEESMSSEATSHGQQEQKRPQRGIVRATSTPGRPVGREAKRHVNKYGYTRLAEACEAGDLDLVKEWRGKDPEQLEIAEFAGNKPLQIAAINGNAEVVSYLIDQGCRIDCDNEERDTPLIDAAENGHADVVDILLDAGVDPLRQNRKGQQALDVINEKTENVTEIRASLRSAIERWSSDDAKQRREEEEEQRYRGGPAKELHFMARSYDNLMRLVMRNDRNSVREFLDARVPVDNAIIAAAAKTGDSYLVNMLLLEIPEKKKFLKAEKPMLAVLGTSHFDMVKILTELENFDPRWKNRQGKTWSEIAEDKAGPMWRQEVELLNRLEKQGGEGKSRQSSSPVARRTDRTRHSGAKADHESDDDQQGDTPKQKKHGRRLLSKKDMRAVSEKKRGHTDDESISAGESEEASRTAPTNKEKRGPGRPRSKSTTIKVEEGEERDRRRSVSHKTVVPPSLSSVAENAEPPAKTSEPSADSSEPAEGTADKADVDMKDADGTTQQDELDRQHAAEQEQAQKAAEAQLQLEEQDRLKQLQEERLEQQNKLKQLQEERLKLEEKLQARNAARTSIVSSLPRHISMQLDAESDFSYAEVGAVNTILRTIEPVQVIYPQDLAPENVKSAQKADPLVLNYCIAPLLGKEDGVDTLLADEHFPADKWESAIKVHDDEKALILPLLRRILFAQCSGDGDEIMTDDQHESFNEQLKKAARMHSLASTAHHALLAAPLTMRWLSLKVVLQRMHPSLRQRKISVSEEWHSIFRDAFHNEAEKDDDDFFDRVAKKWQRPLAPRFCQYGEAFEARIPDSAVGWTAVKVKTHKAQL